MTKRLMDKRALLRALLNATSGPDALSAMRRVVEALRDYTNDEDATAAIGAVLRVHCPVTPKAQDEDE